MSSRESFVRWFGESQARHVENAGEMHLSPLLLPGISFNLNDAHVNDDRGSDPFRYLFIACIANCCFDERYADFHGITVNEQAAKDWCIDQDLVRGHDGDIPDYFAALVGAYDDWMLSPDAARWQPDKEDQ